MRSVAPSRPDPRAVLPRRATIAAGASANAAGYIAPVPHTEPFLVPGDDATLEMILTVARLRLERAAAATRAPKDWRWPVLASVDSRACLVFHDRGRELQQRAG
ncbi:MAG: hypothetical protein NTW15_00520 [Burkholderiales bacterium]|nr:hypothetical protein [Burkholderiales bacterium]